MREGCVSVSVNIYVLEVTTKKHYTSNNTLKKDKPFQEVHKLS